jgi:hypothetical protein
MRRPASIAAVLLAVFLGACGSSGGDRFELRTPGTEDGELPERAPTDGEVAVIRGWSDALRAGHVNKAASYFALPVAVADGTNPLRPLADRAAVRQFNRGLPCGARLEETERGPNSLVIATFRLTERPGPGSCGEGTGHRAWTAFLIRDRLIVQWLRVANPEGSEPEPPSGDLS